MAHVVNVGRLHAPNKAENGEKNHTAQRTALFAPGDGEIAKPQSGYQGSGDPKNRAGSPNFEMVRITGDAEQSPSDPGNHVNAKSLPVAKEALGHATQAPKAPHVHRNMKKTCVNKSRSHQPPILSTQRKWPVISAKSDQSQT